VGFGRGALHLLLQLRQRVVERGHVDGGRGDQARQLGAHLWRERIEARRSLKRRGGKR
jgi:hypothetical protein